MEQSNRRFLYLLQILFGVTVVIFVLKEGSEMNDIFLLRNKLSNSVKPQQRKLSQIYTTTSSQNISLSDVSLTDETKNLEDKAPRKECPPEKRALPPPEPQPERQNKEFNLADQAEYWCHDPEHQPLNYEQCDLEGKYYQIPFMAGLTNGLKMMLLAVITAFEENRCLFVTEANHLMRRDDKSQELDTFIGRYFQPIGLPLDNEHVLKARQEGRVEVSNWLDNWDDHRKRRMHGMLHNITSLGYENMESTLLKRIMLQRMWRLQPQLRQDTCRKLEAHGGLDKDYLAFSVRRGDKNTEGFRFQDPVDYINAAEDVIIEHFNCQTPTIFVATDDCRVMEEFRQYRPEWNFVSECDHATESNGFILAEMRHWTLEQTDAHYHKFFVELTGLAGAKFMIGVTYTNVAWWAVYMRPYRWSHQFLDKKEQSLYQTLDVW